MIFSFLNSIRRKTRALAGAFVLCAGTLACVEELSLAPAPPESELLVGESRTIELRFMRLDVEDFRQTLGLEELRALPRKTLEEQWLMDLDMRPFVENVLKAVKYMPPDEVYALPLPARNMWKLLNMTPQNASLEGTSFEALLGTGKAVGIAPSRILADMVGIDENEGLMPLDLTADVVIENLVSTHPNTKVRKGLVTPEHPDGLYPVAPHSIPVMLEDVASSFEGLAERYGPVPIDPSNPNGAMHPGFLKSAKNIKVTGDDFRMSVKVNLNALPYKGLDADIGAIASVNSLGSQIDSIFDFSDPGWLELSGLVEPAVGELSMVIAENKAFLTGGDAKEPFPTGNSPVWATAPWEFEHILASAGFAKAKQIPAHCNQYGPQGNSTESFQAVELCVDANAWLEIQVDPSVVLESPAPAPSYFWDILVEVAQARLHDGGIAEGDANIELAVKNIPIGLSSAELSSRIRENMESNPRALRAMAEALNNTTDKDADFYYLQPKSGEDWLYFVSPGDLRKDEDGWPVRPYSYVNPGFFADAELKQKISSKEDIEGDSEHEKVRIEVARPMYFEDDQGRRFKVVAGEKPSLHRISLTLTRHR